MIRYRTQEEPPFAVAVECPEEWLTLDADGFTQYENSHFATMFEAIRHAAQCNKIALKWAVEQHERAKLGEAQAREYVAARAALLVNAEKALEDAEEPL